MAAIIGKGEVTKLGVGGHVEPVGVERGSNELA
ncbi:MAG: hypothetical protein ACJARS_003631, partial [bacterium]